MITNLWLFAQAIVKLSILTGFGPAAIAIALFEFWERKKLHRRTAAIHLVRHELTSRAGVRRQFASVRNLQGADRPSYLRSGGRV
jgi:hypothetical protein